MLILLHHDTPPSLSEHSTFTYRREQSPLVLEKQKAWRLNWNKIIQTFASLNVYKFHFIDLYFHKWLSCQSYFFFAKVKKLRREEVLEQTNLQHILALSSWYCKESLEVSKKKLADHSSPFLRGPLHTGQRLSQPGWLTAVTLKLCSSLSKPLPLLQPPDNFLAVPPPRCKLKHRSKGREHPHLSGSQFQKRCF